jgi:hypothetical protein
MAENFQSDKLSLVVCSMDHPFTYDEIFDRMKNGSNIFGERKPEIDLKKMKIELYLDRLVRYGILKRKGFIYWFNNMNK